MLFRIKQRTRKSDRKLRKGMGSKETMAYNEEFYIKPILKNFRLGKSCGWGSWP